MPKSCPSCPPFDSKTPKAIPPTVRSAFLQTIGFSLLAIVVLCITLQPLFTPDLSSFGEQVAVVIKHDSFSSVNEGQRVDFDDVRWAQYSPWRAVEAYRAPPEGCVITQVNLLERHGARYPTDDAEVDIKAALEKMQAMGAYSDEKFGFIHDFVYDLGTEELISFGRMQARDHGEGDYARYPHLFGDDERRTPFVRAAGSPRVIDSATNWTAGVAHGSQGRSNPVLSVVIDELPGVNNSLHNNLCLHPDNSTPQSSTYLAIFAPSIRARLAASVFSPPPLPLFASSPSSPTQEPQPDRRDPLNLTDGDIPPLISLCPFHSVALNTGALSPWCSIFTPSDFDAFEYYHDLKKYYHNGYGAPLGPVQGIAYVAELIARLTDSPVVDHTQTNSTLDSDKRTFPLRKTFYADFSHDHEIAGVMSAMGLLRDEYEGALDPRGPGREGEGRKWRVREMVPFSGRLVVERMTCSNRRPFAQREEGEYVRVLVNDRVMPLEFCEGVSGGVCRLDRFVESQGYTTRGGDGDWEKCFA